jgi:hypothetical protein
MGVLVLHSLVNQTDTNQQSSQGSPLRNTQGELQLLSLGKRGMIECVGWYCANGSRLARMRKRARRQPGLLARRPYLQRQQRTICQSRWTHKP